MTTPTNPTPEALAAMAGEILRLDAEATPGPWRPEREPPPVGNDWFDRLPCGACPVESAGTHFALGVAVAGAAHMHDGVFIAHARTSAPVLARAYLAEHEARVKAEGERDEAREDLEAAQEEAETLRAVIEPCEHGRDEAARLMHAIQTCDEEEGDDGLCECARAIAEAFDRQAAKGKARIVRLEAALRIALGYMPVRGHDMHDSPMPGETCSVCAAFAAIDAALADTEGTGS